MTTVQKTQVLVLKCLFLLIAPVFFLNCSSQKVVLSKNVEKNTEEQTVDDKTVATKPLIKDVEIPTDFFTDIYPGYLRGITIVLELPKNSELSALQLAELNELVRQSRAAGAIYEVSLLAWGSDAKDAKLSASVNIDKIKATLMPLVQHPATTPTVHLTTYNMEVVPAWTSRLLQTKDARIKSHFIKIAPQKMFSRIIIAISTTEQKNFVHPDMTVL